MDLNLLIAKYINYLETNVKKYQWTIENIKKSKNQYIWNMNQSNETVIKEEFKNQPSFKTFQVLRVWKVDSDKFHSD